MVGPDGLFLLRKFRAKALNNFASVKPAVTMPLLAVAKSASNRCYSSRQKMFPKHFLFLRAQRPSLVREFSFFYGGP